MVIISHLLLPFSHWASVVFSLDRLFSLCFIGLLGIFWGLRRFSGLLFGSFWRGRSRHWWRDENCFRGLWILAVSGLDGSCFCCLNTPEGACDLQHSMHSSSPSFSYLCFEDYSSWWYSWYSQRWWLAWDPVCRPSKKAGIDFWLPRWY